MRPILTLKKKPVQWVQLTGRLVYEPHRPDLRKTRKADKFMLVLELKGDIAKYYAWWLKKHFHLEVQLPAWRPHVTVLDGRIAVREEKHHLWKKYQGELITFEYNVNIEQHWKFWTLPVRSERLNEIREELGFARTDKLHLTIGRMS